MNTCDHGTLLCVPCRDCARARRTTVVCGLLWVGVFVLLAWLVKEAVA